MILLYAALIALAAAALVDVLALVLVVRWARRQLRSIGLQTMIAGYGTPRDHPGSSSPGPKAAV